MPIVHFTCSSAFGVAQSVLSFTDGFIRRLLFFKSLEDLPTLERLPRLDDRLLGAFRAFTRLPPCLEDERLWACRRFLPRFERGLAAEEEAMDREWRRLLLRLFLPCLASDRVAELPRPRALRARPLRQLRDDCLDLPRLAFLLALRCFGASLAASLMLLGEELLERFLRLALGALVATTASLVEGFSLSGCVTSAAFRNFRAAGVAMRCGAAGSSDAALGGRPRGRLAAGASLEGPAAFVSCSLRSPRLWRTAVGLRLFLHHGVVASGLVPASAVDREEPAMLLSPGARRQAFPRRRLWWNSGESPD
ncbi:hypothetical protein MTO96_039592 [Rhipicephalus appendiculatus]